MSEASKTTKKRRSPILIFLLLIVVLVAFVLGIKFRGLIWVAQVGKQPIFSWEYFSYLAQNYGQRAMDDLTAERLINQKATDEEVVVSEEELNQEISKIKEEFGDDSVFEETLESQGIDYPEFKKRVRLQLLTEKILEKRLTITDLEIEAFIRQYETQMESTGEAALKREAQETLRAQKMQEAYYSLIPTLEEEIKVSQFLNF